LAGQQGAGRSRALDMSSRDERSKDEAPTCKETAPTVVFDTKGRLLLQLRDDIPEILFPGMIGLFGGHREGAETFLQCAVRELEEELSYSIPPERFEHIATFKGVYRELPGTPVHAEIFVVRDVPADELIVTEGSLLVFDVSQIHELEHRLTPTARIALAKVLGEWSIGRR
jgi:8-oxo-dGTP diphosphatase